MLRLHYQASMGARRHTLRVSNGSIINYCHIIWDEFSKDAVLIDPVWELEKFTRFIFTYNLCPKAILLTHHHFDHTNLADALSSHYRIPAYISHIESTVYQYEITNLTWIPYQRDMTFGRLRIRAIHTPGHTSGSVCYQISDALFSGDTLFIEGCGVCWGKGADPVDMFQSLQRLKNLLHPKTRIYPGHRYASELGKTFDDVMRLNIYLSINNVDDFVRFRMRRNQKGIFQFI